MPPMSTIQTFIDALRTGQTRTTRGLNEIFGEPAAAGAALKPDQAALLGSPGGLDALAGWMRDLLKRVSDPLTDAELDHIDEWPRVHKERVRLALVRAIEDDVAVRFSWEIHSGAAPDTAITDQGTDGIFVTFRSPRARVRLEGDGAGEIFVGS